MATAKQVLSKAASYIGYKEKPAGSNKTIFGKHYGMNGVAWCAIFQWDMFRMAGASKLFYGGKRTAYTPTLASYYKKHNQWHKTPKVGDLVFFSNGIRIIHVGIVEKIISKNIIQTIEGNTGTTNQANGGMVMRRQRSIKGTASWHVAGFGRPAYSKPKVTKPAAKPTVVKPAEVAKPIAKPAVTKPVAPATKPKKYVLKAVLKKGSRGENVKKLQQALKAKGYKVSADGVFGANTEKAVKAFQKKNKLTADGVVGRKTAAKLGWSFK